MYFVRTPYIIKKLFPVIIWDMPAAGNKVYLTFDDGPHPEITPRILEQLRRYESKATFFCLGKNVEKYPEIVQRILREGHLVGNHGYKHLNGWKTNDGDYWQDYLKGQEMLKQVHQDAVLFRPAYGKIKKSQISKLKFQNSEVKPAIVNWSLMPGDFDTSISAEQCFSNLVSTVRSGDIICLHDNEKAARHLEFCLPGWLDFIYNKGLKSDSLTL